MAAMSVNSFKALGPDGFQPFFFKRYWSVIKDDLWRMVQSAFNSSFFDAQLAETLIILIPEGKNPSFLRNFRPISFYNVAYKVISNVLVNRLGSFPGKRY